jgi:hypothetical protein
MEKKITGGRGQQVPHRKEGTQRDFFFLLGAWAWDVDRAPDGCEVGSLGRYPGRGAPLSWLPRLIAQRDGRSPQLHLPPQTTGKQPLLCSFLA